MDGCITFLTRNRAGQNRLVGSVGRYIYRCWFFSAAGVSGVSCCVRDDDDASCTNSFRRFFLSSTACCTWRRGHVCVYTHGSLFLGGALQLFYAFIRPPLADGSQLRLLFAIGPAPSHVSSSTCSLPSFLFYSPELSK